ncbi:MAG: exodeoxyribonuclease VII small subunit [Firmicutes bacterium]|nr:exodeoxyribonuclease VII small subunit [Bacillota bacterium]
MSDSELSFEKALSRLEEVVKQLEDGQVPLEEALELFSEGIRLSKICNNKLDNVEQRVQLLLTDSDGKPVLRETDSAIGGGNE